MDYQYTRKDGGTVDCYGDITDHEYINFSLVCADERWDELVEFDERPTTWAEVCKRLATTIDNLEVEEITLM